MSDPSRTEAKNAGNEWQPGPEWRPIDAYLPLGVRSPQTGKEMAHRVEAWLYVGDSNENKG